MDKQVQDQLKRNLAKWQGHLNQLGPHLTGSYGHVAFIEWLKTELLNMQYDFKNCTQFFNYCEVNCWRLRLQRPDKSFEEIRPIGYVPYSGLTSANGVTGTLTRWKRFDKKKIKNKLVLLDVYPYKTNRRLLYKVYSQLPSRLDLPSKLIHPAITSQHIVTLIKKIRNLGASGIILICHHFPEKLMENNILPFTDTYLGIPTLWINQKNAACLIAAAAQNKKVCLTLTGTYHKKWRTESLAVTIPGTLQNSKSIIISSHTDGPNSIEGNGPLGVLAILKYFHDQKIVPQKSLHFLFISGHSQLSQLGKKEHSATTNWLTHYPEYWDGEKDHQKALLCLTMEHLGSLKFSKENIFYASTHTARKLISHFSKTNQLNNKKILVSPRKCFYLSRTNAYKIPTISLTPLPLYLFQLADKQVTPDSDVMFKQIFYYLELLLLADKDL